MPTASKKPKCYVASPLGFTEAGRHYYEQVLLPELSQAVDTVDPWSWVTPRQVTSARNRGRLGELWLEIGMRNARAIAEADLLVACLDGQEIDSGTASEVGYAAGRGVCCFGLRTDLRQAGEAEMLVNLQLESFIRQSGGSIHGSLKALTTALRRGIARRH